MYTKEIKTVKISFDAMDRLLIKRLIVEQVGDMTIAQVLDSMSIVFDWYLAMMKMLKKIAYGDYVTLDSDEINVLVSLLSKAYNSETETEKEAIKKIADAIDLISK